jgi:hypothetical protein
MPTTNKADLADDEASYPVERLVGVTDEDHEQFLLRIKDRFTRCDRTSVNSSDLLGGFYAHRTMSSSPWQRRHGASNHRGARPRAGRRGGGPRRRETGAAQRHQLHDQRRDGI